MGRTEFPQRTSWGRLNSPRTTSCALPCIGNITVTVIINNANTRMELPRIRFTPCLLGFLFSGDGEVCNRARSIQATWFRAEHHSSLRARLNQKGTDTVTLAGASRKVQSTKSIRDIAIVWISRICLTQAIAVQSQPRNAIIVRRRAWPCQLAYL